MIIVILIVNEFASSGQCAPKLRAIQTMRLSVVIYTSKNTAKDRPENRSDGLPPLQAACKKPFETVQKLTVRCEHRVGRGGHRYDFLTVQIA